MSHGIRALGLSGIPQTANVFWVGLWVFLVVLVSRRLASSRHGRSLWAMGRIREGLAHTIKKMGHTAVTAKSGAEGIAAFKSRGDKLCWA